MRLCTYSFLSSKAVKGVKVGYPLKLTVTKQTNIDAEFNGAFIERVLPRISWSAIRLAAEQVGMANDIPAEQPERVSEVAGLLEKLHHLLMEIDVLDGELQCPETGRVYEIRDGIPNMLINEDEV